MKSSGLKNIAGCLLLTLTACNNVPDYVIQPDEMSEVMADIHVAEAVVESNYQDYRTDSLKMLLKQSVLAKHRYTLAQLDTSFMWYGAHLTVYDEVYDHTIELLEERLKESGALIQSMQSENAGDSINLWDRTPFMFAKTNSPSKNLKFDFKADETWSKGDMFTIRAKYSNSSGSTFWTISADYDDGTFEILSNKFNGDGWHEMSFYTDSLKQPTRVYGALNISLEKGSMVIDSLQILKKPLDAIKYSQRYRQRSYDFKNKKSKPEEREVD